MKTSSPTSKIALAAACGLAAFSGSVACWGLAKFTPGSEVPVMVMCALLEVGKLSSFALLHKTLPRALKLALVAVGLVLMGLNVVGVSGMLSAAYEHSLLAAQASAHVALSSATGEVAVLERQLVSPEQSLAAASAALLRARDDRGRVRAAQSAIAAARADRDAAATELSAARAAKSSAEGRGIEAGGELAAVAFLAGATGYSQDAVAHLVILIIAALPDTLAVLLLLASQYKAPAPAKVVRRRRVQRSAPPRRRPPAALKVVSDAAA